MQPLLSFIEESWWRALSWPLNSREEMEMGTDWRGRYPAAWRQAYLNRRSLPVKYRRWFWRRDFCGATLLCTCFPTGFKISRLVTVKLCPEVSLSLFPPCPVSGSNLFIPTIVGETLLQRYQCHVFRWLHHSLFSFLEKIPYYFKISLAGMTLRPGMNLKPL